MKLHLPSICALVLSILVAALSWAREPHALKGSTQILIVTTQDWNAVNGVLHRYERAKAGGKWKAAGDPISIVVGKNGLGWGAGLDARDMARLREPLDPVKKEGDRKSPAGLFRLSTSFGYAAQAQAGWKMPYLSLTPAVECVDDATSKYYNRVIDSATVARDWNSSEKMAQAGVYYRWGLVVDHNTDPVTPGAGSCIFMHVWGGDGTGTVGCTAMAQEQLEAVLAWLDPQARPVLLQLPVGRYEKRQRKWHLPALDAR